MEILKSINSMILDLFTIEELKNKGIKEVNFAWKINFKNVNLIPLLELYKKDKIYKTIEAIEFSKKLQNLLRETHNLRNEITNVRSIENLLDYLDEGAKDCDVCEFKNDCFLRDDKM